MKTKIFLLLAVCAIITLSFTFSTSKGSGEKEIPKTADAPAGGFASEGKF